MKTQVLIRRYMADDRGATSLEYALIIGLIFLVILGALTLFAENATTKFKAATDAIAGAD